MKKTVLLTLVLALSLSLSPIHAISDMAAEGTEIGVQHPTLTVQGNHVRISGANGQVLEVFNLTGVKVSTIRIDSSEKSFTLRLPKGCYILKVAKVVRKISVS